MKKIITLLLILHDIFLCQIPSETDLADKKIISEKDLKAYGIGNLSDIFSLADKWFSSTIDRINWQAAANSLSTFQRQNYLVMIDDQRFEINIFDNQNINLLPISINQIDYIEFINSPQIYNGEFTERGLINFHTKNPVKQFSAQFSQLLGNETGDPGPFKYTDYRTPNIDKLNSNTSLVLNYGSKNWFLSGSIKTEENYATSSALNDRISNLSLEYNKVRLTSSFVKLSVDAFGTTHQVLAGFSTQNDFFFFKPYGNEIPVKRRIQHAGLNGQYNLFPNISLNYLARFSTNELNEWTNKKNINFDFQLQNYLIKIEGVYSSKFVKSILGISFDEYKALTSISLMDDNFLFRKVYLNSTFPISKNYTQQAGIYLIKSKDHYSIKGILSNNLNLDTRQTIKSSFTFSDRQYYEDLNYFTWYENGYSIPLTQKLSTNILGELNKSQTITADIYYILKLDSLFKIDANAGYRQFSNLYLEKETYQYLTDESSFVSKYDIITNNNCKIITANLSINYFMLPRLEQTIQYSYQKDIYGNEFIRQVWKSFPTHQLSWFVNYQPYNDFGISTVLKYSSSTEWIDYRYAAFQSDEQYEGIIKPRLIFNIAIQKWFLKRTIWTSFTFKNIFNQAEYFNPIGAKSNLRFYFQVHIYLNSLPE